MAYGTISVDRSTVYFGQQVVFTPTYFEYENRVVLTYSFAGTSTRTGTIDTSSPDQYGRFTWTVPAALAPYCSGDSGVCTVTATFFSGNTQTGVRTLKLSLLAYKQQVVSVPDIVKTNGAYIGDTVHFSTVHYGALDTIDLRYSFTGSATTSGTIADGILSGASATWTVPNIASSCTTLVSGVCTVTATIKIGATTVKTETLKIALKIPNSSAYYPTLGSSDVTLTEANSTVSGSGLGMYLQGESKLTIAANPTPAYQSPIAKCVVVFDGVSYTDTSSPFSVTTGTIAKSGTASTRSVPWSVTVTDGRGRSTTRSGSITAYLYNRPQITTQFTGQRCDSSGNYQQDGTIVKVTFAGKYTVLTGNTYTTKIAYSANNGSTYTDAKSYTASSGNVSATNDKLTNITYVATTKYLMRLTLADKLYTTTAVITIPTLKVLLDFRSDGTGLGIGMINQNGSTIDSAWTYRGTFVDCLSNAFLRAYRTDYSGSAAPASNIWGTIAAGYDSAGVDRAYLRQVAMTDGTQGVQVETKRTVSGTTYYNGLRLMLDASGNQSVIVANAAAWRTALGLGTAATQASSSFASAGHNHDSAYLKLSGGTLTGELKVNSDINRRGSGYIFFAKATDASDKFRAGLAVTSANRLYFRSAKTDGATYHDVFYLPTPENTSTSADAVYYILTTKAAVTVAQGGTGATTAVNARTNLGVNGKEWNDCNLGSFNTTGATITLPSAGTWLIITGHNSTASLNTVWIVRTGGNKVFGLAAAGTGIAGISGYTMCGTVGMKCSGTSLTGITVAGGVNVYGIKLG